MSVNKNLLWSAFFFLFAINMPVYVTTLFSNPVTQLVIILVIYAICTGLVLFVYYKRIPARDKHDNSLGVTLLSGTIGILLGLCFQFVMIWLSHFFTTQPLVNTQQFLGQENSWLLLIPIIFVPIMEECVFRYSLISFLNQKLSMIWSVLISSVVFALMHDAGHVLTYTGLGILFYLVYRYSKNIMSPIIAHVGMNLVIILLNSF